jgi:hypothetical protein
LVSHTDWAAELLETHERHFEFVDCGMEGQVVEYAMKLSE